MYSNHLDKKKAIQFVTTACHSNTPPSPPPPPPPPQTPSNCTGPTGHIGYRGHTGYRGKTGCTGHIGYRGYSGPTGTTGPAGVRGPPGLNHVGSIIYYVGFISPPSGWLICDGTEILPTDPNYALYADLILTMGSNVLPYLNPLIDINNNTLRGNYIIKF